MAIFAALAGHVSAGGEMPGALGIVVPWMLSFMVCVLLAGRRLNAIRLGISVGVSQFLFHVLFVLGSITPTGASGTGHVHGSALVLPESAGLTETVAAGGMMWFGHAIAALATIVALHRGERLLLALRDLAEQSVRWLQRRIDAILAPPTSHPAPRPALHVEIAVLRSAVLLSPLRGRAPPRGATV